MLVTYDGIIVGRREVGENSCFIDILTDEQGIVEASAHGVKKLNSSLMSSAAIFSYATYCLNKSKGHYTVNSAKPKFSFHGLGSDIEKLSLASYFAQSVKFCASSEQNQLEDNRESIVRFMAIALYETLNTEKNGRSLSTVKAAFELRYSAILGYSPNLVACENCGRYKCERGMYFLPRKGELICADCLNPEYNGVRINLFPQTLHAMRNIVFSPIESAFRFTICGEPEKQLSAIAEDYFLYRTERTFTALEYYKMLVGGTI